MQTRQKNDITMAQNRPVYHIKALGTVNDDYHLTLSHFSRNVKCLRKSRSYCNHAIPAFKVLQMANQACDDRHLTPDQPCNISREQRPRKQNHFIPNYTEGWQASTLFYTKRDQNSFS